MEIFQSTLPCIVRFGQAFPPLLDECVLYLLQFGKIAVCQSAIRKSNTVQLSVPASLGQTAIEGELLIEEIKATYTKLLDDAVLRPRIY